MMRQPTGSTLVAGVVGAPVAHSLSPTLHNAWIAAGGLDAVYVAFAPPVDRFARFIDGLRGGVVRGLNVTAPFKETALGLADRCADRAAAAGAANLLIFEGDGTIFADNTDGQGLIAAFAVQAPAFDPADGPVVVLGAGGAARGAVSALLGAGAPEVRILNRSATRGEVLARLFGPRCRFWPARQASEALSEARALVNATPAGSEALDALGLSLDTAPGTLSGAFVVMDMVYRPLRTPLLKRAEHAGFATVDGLAMLIGQAEPSFARLFSAPPPPIDVRALALARLEGAR